MTWHPGMAKPCQTSHRPEPCKSTMAPKKGPGFLYGRLFWGSMSKICRMPSGYTCVCVYVCFCVCGRRGLISPAKPCGKTTWGEKKHQKTKTHAQAGRALPDLVAGHRLKWKHKESSSSLRLPFQLSPPPPGLGLAFSWPRPALSLPWPLCIGLALSSPRPGCFPWPRPGCFSPRLVFLLCLGLSSSLPRPIFFFA